MTTMDTSAVKCCKCGVEKAITKRLPTGWKRVGEVTTCADCWRGQFALRAVTIPIVSPVCIGKPGEKDSREMDWPELRRRLRESFSATTEAANFIVREMAKLDAGFELVGGKRRLSKLPKCYFYPEVRRRWPTLATCSVNSLEQAVQAKYRASRFDVATSKVSLPSFRYPHPIPVHNATWDVWEDAGGRLLLSFQLSGERVTVRLRGGADYRRQLMDLRRVMKGEVVQGQLDLSERGDKVLAKVVGWFPKTERTGEYAASLVTGGDAFLTLYNDERRTIYRWNADHIKRRIVAQDERMQRLREDLKAEKRLGRERDGILARMEQLSEDFGNYLHSFCHETSRQVIEHLRRRRCGVLMFVDADRSYMPHFPWHKLSSMLADKAARANIQFASGDAASETPEPLEVETQQ